jgi:hypothetical protein
MQHAVWNNLPENCQSVYTASGKQSVQATLAGCRPAALGTVREQVTEFDPLKPEARLLMLRIAWGESRNILPYKPEARARGNVRRYPLARAF